MITEIDQKTSELMNDIIKENYVVIDKTKKYIKIICICFCCYIAVFAIAAIAMIINKAPSSGCVMLAALSVPFIITLIPMLKTTKAITNLFDKASDTLSSTLKVLEESRKIWIGLNLIVIIVGIINTLGFGSLALIICSYLFN